MEQTVTNCENSLSSCSESNTVAPRQSSPALIQRETEKLENQLANVLVSQILPPFNQSLKVQALIVYQNDLDGSRCLLVNRAYQRANHNGPNIAADAVQKETSLSAICNLATIPSCSSPSLLEQPAIQSAMKEEEDVKFVPTDDSRSGSRRKRKFCRPCKIPQQPQATLSVAQPITISNCVTAPSLVLHEAPKIFITSSQNVFLTNEVSAMLNKKPSFASELKIDEEVTTPKVVTQVSTPPTQSLPRPQMILNGARPILPRIITESPLPSKTETHSAAVSKIVDVSALQASNPNSESTDSYSALARRYPKNFACNQCRDAFVSLSKLCEHTFSVHRAFRCTICNAQFTQRSNLQRHSLRHVGFKPFVCKVCEKAYYRKDHLVRHIEVSHPGADPRTSLTAKLTSAECLEYLDRMYAQVGDAVPFESEADGEQKEESSGENEPQLTEMSGVTSGLNA